MVESVGDTFKSSFPSHKVLLLCIFYDFLTPRSLQILWHRISLISECLGTADLVPVTGFHHQECLPPSRISSQPCERKCDKNLRLFTQRFELLQTCYQLHSGHQVDSYEVLPEARTGGFPITLPSLLPGSLRHRFLRSIRSRNRHPSGLLQYICSC